MAGIRIGIVVEVSVIGVVKKDSVAGVGVGIVGDEVGVVEERSDVRKACTIEKEVVIEV
jgi:hypothetical protein